MAAQTSHDRFSPDGWVFDPSACERMSTPPSAGPDITWALNISLIEPLWVRNPCTDVPRSESTLCWASIQSHFVSQAAALRASTWTATQRAAGRSMRSFSFTGARRAVIIGIPLATARERGLPLPERHDDDIWIGVNWALRDPDGLDLCWTNSMVPWYGLPRRAPGSTGWPMLVCSVTTNAQIASEWPAPVFFYAPPSAIGMHPSDAMNVGALHDPGDAACAAVIWALERARVTSIVLVEADGTQAAQNDTLPSKMEYMTRGRMAHTGRGSALAALAALAHMASATGIDVSSMSGWPLLLS